MFDKVQRAVDFNHRNNGVDRIPSIGKKRLLRKKYKKHFFSSFQKTKTTQTSGPVFAETIEKVKKTKFELELIKFEYCFLDDHGNYDSKLESFRIKSLYETKFFATVSMNIRGKQNARLKWDSKQNFQVLSDFKTKIFQRVRFWIKNFRTCRILS